MLHFFVKEDMRHQYSFAVNYALSRRRGCAFDVLTELTSSVRDCAFDEVFPYRDCCRYHLWSVLSLVCRVTSSISLPREKSSLKKSVWFGHASAIEHVLHAKCAFNGAIPLIYYGTMNFLTTRVMFRIKRISPAHCIIFLLFRINWFVKNSLLGLVPALRFLRLRYAFVKINHRTLCKHGINSAEWPRKMTGVIIIFCN